ncbi:Hypothetical protein AKI40_1390 [Enterobacter sp. FY-07]|nr:Hypothetical protein AKI40_1390 [Enterobacter sp. FY-07]
MLLRNVVLVAGGNIQWTTAGRSDGAEGAHQPTQFAANTQRFIEIHSVILKRNGVDRAHLFAGGIVAVAAENRCGLGFRSHQRQPGMLLQPLNFMHIRTRSKAGIASYTPLGIGNHKAVHVGSLKEKLKR